MKKFISFLLLLLVPFTLVGKLNFFVDASQTLSPYVNKHEDVITRQYLEGGVMLEKQIVETLRFGKTEDPIWSDQTVQWVSMPTNNDAIKVAVWSEGTNDAWKSSTVRNTLLDYEAKHPGWKVVAAVNGDFFDIGNTFQPSGAYVQDGDVLKADGGRPVIGFKEDGTHVYGVPTKQSFMTLSIFDETTTEKIQIAGVNKKPGNTGITLLTTALASSIDLTGFTVYVGNYTLNRVTPGGHFVKGAIAEVKDDFATISKVPLGKFYLVTKDASFNAKLTINKSVKAEHELTNDFAGVTMTMGTSAQIITDGEPQFKGLVETVHPRTVLGYRADGSIVLMVIDGRLPAERKNGVGLFEAGELLRLQGVVNGYNLDGGGSSTLIIRNDAGELEVINTPSDGSERSIGNAVLFVMRDPKIEMTGVTGSTMTFEQMGPLVNATIKDVKVEIGNKIYPLENSKVVVTNLLKNTVYNVIYHYTITNPDGTDDICKSKVYKIKTESFDVPIVKEFEKHSVQNLGITIKYSYEDKSKDVKRAYIAYDGKEFELTKTSGRAAITGLVKDQEYEFKLVLELKNDEVIEGDILTFVAEGKAKSGSSGCQTGSAFVLVSTIIVAGFALVIFKRKE